MKTTLDSLKKIFNRDLDLLYKEIEAYPSEQSVWVIKGEIKNSGGNLSLHLCGNLQHFIGKILGNSNYVRNREAEFADRDIPREKLLSEIVAAKRSVDEALSKLAPEKLEEIYPIDVFGEPMTTNYFLIHLAAHLTYHRGQINYHRRLIA